jgi:BirA family transcriptional regulator, biotin operon repressor / biotin---[acetyl-CoA-carboxylase] ligase
VSQAVREPGSRLGALRVHLRRIDSTNDRARTLAIAGAPHGTLVTASEQSAGRGRQGRRWEAPAGSSVLMSVVLRAPPPLLPLIAAVAVCDVAGERAMIKWPNDIVFAAEPSASAELSASASPGLAKLAGILAEGRPQEGWAVLGIGLNVAVRLEQLPPELQTGSPQRAGLRRAALPAATLGRSPADVERVLAGLLEALERRLGEPSEATLQTYRSRDSLLGREISWTGGSGRAEGVDGLGRLVVALADGGRTTLEAGEVHLQSIA